MKVNRNFTRSFEKKVVNKWEPYSVKNSEDVPFTQSRIDYDRSISKKDGYTYRVYHKKNKKQLTNSIYKVIAYDKNLPNERIVYTRSRRNSNDKK